MNKLFERFESSMEGFAILLSDSLSSMTMFWLISLLVIIPLLFSQPVGVVGWMQYIVSVFFQGVALPVLAYTSKISGTRTDKIIKKIADLSEKIETLSEKIVKDVDDIKDDVDDIKDDVEENDSNIKVHVNDIKENVDDIKENVDDIKEDINNIKEDINK